MSSPLKVVITTIPFIDWNTPISSPAYLSALLNNHGVDCVGLDLNIEIYNKIKNDPLRNLYLDFFYHQKIDAKIYKSLSDMLYHYAKKILEHRPTHIGLSLFTHDSQVFTVWLCHLLQKIAPKIKIIIGGPGLYTLSQKKNVSFPESLRSSGLIDHFIVGDVTSNLNAYFKEGIKESNMNVVAQQDLEFHNIVTPNYDHYDFFNYEHKRLPIVDSRGCVQKCEFCDVIEFWKKFQYLSAQNVFSQMQELIEKYNIYRFDFASSISNGNLVEFTKLIRMIAQYNRGKVFSKQIHWNGNFIIRKKGRHTDLLFNDIKESNGRLICGVESLSSTARIKLGKNFTNEDLDDHLVQCKAHGVQIDLLMIAAYHTETQEDYADALQWFETHKNYAGSVITRVQMTLLGILDGTKLSRDVDLKRFNDGREAREVHANKLYEKAKQCGFHVDKFW